MAREMPYLKLATVWAGGWGSTEKARVGFGKGEVGEAAVDLVKSDVRQWEPTVPLFSSLNETLC